MRTLILASLALCLCAGESRASGCPTIGANVLIQHSTFAASDVGGCVQPAFAPAFVPRFGFFGARFGGRFAAGHVGAHVGLAGRNAALRRRLVFGF